MDTSDINRRPFDLVLYCISLAVLIVASVPAFLPKFIRLVAVLLVGAVHYQIIFTQTTGNLAADLSLGSAILVQYLIGVDYALFTSPEDAVDYCDRDASKVTQRSFKKRVRWTLRLYSNPRGIGWAHEPAHLPPRPLPSTPRFKFVFTRIFFAMGCFSATGILSVVNASNPGLTTPGVLLTEAPLHWRALGVTCFGICGVFTISALNSILSAVVVGCGYSSPERWPRLFGSLFEIWSIQGFWRRFWHQMIRRTLLVHSSIFLRYIFTTSQTETIPYKLARLYSAFFISGIIHMAGDAMVTGKIIFKAFTFFMLQPFGITIELLVAHLWRQFTGSQDKIPMADGHVGHLNEEYTKPEFDGGRRQSGGLKRVDPPLWIRCVGFIWLVFWMAWTAPYIVDPLCAVGVFVDPRIDLRRLL